MRALSELTAKEAAPYFAHKAHRPDGIQGEVEDWMTFRATDGVCGAFHMHLWPGVWMGHLGALPGTYRVDDAVRAILAGFADEFKPSRIIGWVAESNRPMIALARRVGFEIDGRLPLARPVVMLGWRPEWLV